MPTRGRNDLRGEGDRIGPRGPIRLPPSAGGQETLTQRTTRTTETGSRDDHPHTGRHLAPDAFRLPWRRAHDRRNRLKSLEKPGGCPCTIPECEHAGDWVAEGAVSSEPVSHVGKRT